MNRPMTSLDNLRVFMRSVELGSFSAAGRSMRMSAAVVSYRMAALERELGCQLLLRTTRRMNLTERGRLFYERCREVIEAIERAEASVREASGDLRGAVRITAPLGLGRRVVAPLAMAFRTAHPNVDFRMRLSDHLLDLVGESTDVALRMARFDDSTFTIRKIADVERMLCAAPAYLDAMGAPRSPDDLLAHRCLLLRYPGAQQFRWTLLVGGAPTSVPVAGPLDADDGDVLTDWALAGQGIVLKPRFEVAALLAEGRLREVLPDYPPLPVSVAALSPSRRASRLTRAVTDALIEATRTHIREALRPGADAHAEDASAMLQGTGK